MNGRYWLLVIGAVLPALLFAGCKSRSGDQKDSSSRDVLPLGTWKLITLDGRGIPPDVRMTLELMADGKVAGSTGVNRYFGTYSQPKPGSISFSPLGSTRRAGSPEEMQRESEFFGAMSKINTYRAAADVLEMGDGQLTLLTWRR